MSEPHNFDQELGREARRESRETVEFVIAGETFRAVLEVPAEVLRPVGKFTPDFPFDVKLDAVHEVINGFLHPEDRARWADLKNRGSDEDALTYDDLHAVCGWLIETDAGRPTTPPSASTTTPATGGTSTTSTEDSALQAEPAPTH